MGEGGLLLNETTTSPAPELVIITDSLISATNAGPSSVMNLSRLAISEIFRAGAFVWARWTYRTVTLAHLNTPKMHVTDLINMRRARLIDTNDMIQSRIL